MRILFFMVFFPILIFGQAKQDKEALTKEYNRQLDQYFELSVNEDNLKEGTPEYLAVRKRIDALSASMKLLEKQIDELKTPDDRALEKWSFSEDKDKWTDEPVQTFSTNSNSNSFRLVIRTKSSKIDVFFYSTTSIYGDDYRTLKFRIDKDKAVVKEFNLSTDNKALFVPDNFLDFVTRIFTAETIIVQDRPLFGTPGDYTFDLKGFRLIVAKNPGYLHDIFSELTGSNTTKQVN